MTGIYRGLFAALLFAVAPSAGAQQAGSVLFRDAEGFEVHVDDLGYYFSPWAPGNSRSKMATVPNIELAIENLYIARRLAARAQAEGLTEQIDSDWLQRFLVNREFMKVMLNHQVEEQLLGTDWAGLARDHYLSHPQEFMEPEQIRASHILFELEGRRLIDVMREADLARDRILAGEAFADVATEVTDDVEGLPGGDLGFFAKGRMVPAFEEAAFGLEEGQVSDLVVTSYGVHLIQQTGRIAERLIPYDLVERTIIDTLKPKVWRETREQVLTQYRAEMLSGENYIDQKLVEELRSSAQAE